MKAKELGTGLRNSSKILLRNSNAEFALTVIILGYNVEISCDTSRHHDLVQHSLLLSVLVATLVQSVQKLNVYAFFTFMLLAVRWHHKFKEICPCFFTVIPDLSVAISYGSDLV